MSAMLNNPFALFGFIAVGCVATIVVMEVIKSTKEAAACRQSEELIAVITCEWAHA